MLRFKSCKLCGRSAGGWTASDQAGHTVRGRRRQVENGIRANSKNQITEYSIPPVRPGAPPLGSPPLPAIFGLCYSTLAIPSKRVTFSPSLDTFLNSMTWKS
jgi:hypothetical protein